MNDLTTYKQVRHCMKTGDCIQWQSKRALIGWLIKVLSHSKFNHSSLVIALREYGNLKDRRFILEAVGEIELRLLSKRLEDYSGHVWWYPLKDEYDECRDKIGEWALLKIGVAYDYTSIWKQITGRVSADAKKLFCSEFCFLGWKFGGIRLKGKAPRPGDIPKYDIFKKPVQLI